MLKSDIILIWIVLFVWKRNIYLLYLKNILLEQNTFEII